MAFRPAARHIGEYGQDGQFIIVIPKNEWVVPKQDEAKSDDDQAGTDCAEEIQPPINRDLHRRRKRNLLICVSPVFIRG